MWQLTLPSFVYTFIHNYWATEQSRINIIHSSHFSIVWESHISSVNYTISVCQPLSKVTTNLPCDDQAAVCQVDADGHATNIGTFSTTPIVTEIQSEGVIQLRLQGDACKENDGQRYTTIINFKCGKTLVRIKCFVHHFDMYVKLK
jgi:hypothetical protein